jgi:hypothetical protein
MARLRTLIHVPRPGADPEELEVQDRHPSDPDYYTTGKVNALDWPEKDPAPIVLSTDPRPADAPEERKAMVNVVKFAQKNGWDVRVGYSLGQARAVKRGTYKMVHTFGLWGLGYGWRWCAMYAWSPDLAGEWAWDGTAIWRADAGPVAMGLGSRFVDANVTDLRAFLGLNGGVGPAWFKGVHARVEEQKARQKAKAKTATPKAKEGAS